MRPLSLTVRCAFGFASLSVILTGKAVSLCESDVGACAIGSGRVDVTIGSLVGEALVVHAGDGDSLADVGLGVVATQRREQLIGQLVADAPGHLTPPLSTG